MEQAPNRDMELYLDTNVYNVIAARGEVESVRQFLVESGHRIVVSETNLTETWAAPRYEQRKARIETMTALASSFCDLPIAFLHSRELVREIRRLRPDWIRQFPSRNAIRRSRAFLENHKHKWKESKESSGERPVGFVAYESHAGSADVSDLKRVRRAFLEAGGGRVPNDLRISVADGELAALTTHYEPIEVYARLSLALIWQGALRDGHPAMSDYNDFVGPYVKAVPFGSRDYFKFWLVDLDLSNVPLNIVTAMADFYQKYFPITRGDFGDVNHANYLLLSDAIVTEDRSFVGVLDRVRNHLSRSAIAFHVSRHGGTIASQLTGYLKEVPLQEGSNHEISAPFIQIVD